MNISAVAEAVGVLSVGAGGFAFARRFGGGSALAELERANGVLERRMHELEETNTAQAKRIAELEAKTDVSAVTVAVLEALHRHEEQAQARSASMLRVLDLIAARLGPEPAAA